MNVLRQYIRLLIETGTEEEDSDKAQLITEPDETDGREEDEVSVVANVAGVTTPLGTGPTYPDKSSKRRQSPTKVAGRSFGNAVPLKRS